MLPVVQPEILLITKVQSANYENYLIISRPVEVANRLFSEFFIRIHQVLHFFGEHSFFPHQLLDY